MCLIVCVSIPWIFDLTRTIFPSRLSFRSFQSSTHALILFKAQVSSASKIDDSVSWERVTPVTLISLASLKPASLPSGSTWRPQFKTSHLSALILKPVSSAKSSSISSSLSISFLFVTQTCKSSANPNTGHINNNVAGLVVHSFLD